MSSAQIRVDAKGEKLNGNVKKMVECQYGFGYRNRKPLLVETAIYTYDEKTNQEAVYYYWSSDSTRYVYSDIFKFDGRKLTEHQHVEKVAHGSFMKEDSIYYIFTNKYDDSNRLIEELRISKHHDSSKTVYLYDKHGNVIEKDRFNGVEKKIFKYDSGGHIIQKDSYDDRVTYHTIYMYRSNYHYSEENTIDTFPDRERKTIRRYDDRMNLIEERSFCRCDDTHTKNKYKYDDKGNWVERTNYLHGKKYGYIKRVITY